MSDNTTVPSAEEIMTQVANEHSYETWGELMNDIHEHSQIDYTKEAMHEHTRLHLEAMLSEITSGDEKVLLKRDIEKTGNNYISNI